jgi:hypothetical protein
MMTNIDTFTKWGEPARITFVNPQRGSHRRYDDQNTRYIVHVTVFKEDGTEKSKYNFWGVNQSTVNSVLAEPINLEKILQGGSQ